MSICIYIECEFAMSSCTPVCLRLYKYNLVSSCLVSNILCTDWPRLLHYLEAPYIACTEWHQEMQCTCLSLAFLVQAELRYFIN